MRIKIHAGNADKITAAIAEIDKRCSARTGSYDDVLAAVSAAEARLAFIPKKFWTGATVQFDGHVLPKAMLGAFSTHVLIERGNGAWYYAGAKRDYTLTRSYGAGHGTCKVALPDTPGILESVLNKASIQLRSAA